MASSARQLVKYRKLTFQGLQNYLREYQIHFPQVCRIRTTAPGNVALRHFTKELGPALQFHNPHIVFEHEWMEQNTRSQLKEIRDKMTLERNKVTKVEQSTRAPGQVLSTPDLEKLRSQEKQILSKLTPSIEIEKKDGTLLKQNVSSNETMVDVLTLLIETSGTALVP